MPATAPCTQEQMGGQPSQPPAIGMAQWMRGRALRSGPRPALSFEGLTWSYGQLQSQIERAAAVLAQGGLRPGIARKSVV